MKYYKKVYTLLASDDDEEEKTEEVYLTEEEKDNITFSIDTDYGYNYEYEEKYGHLFKTTVFDESYETYDCYEEYYNVWINDLGEILSIKIIEQ